MRTAHTTGDTRDIYNNIDTTTQRLREHSAEFDGILISNDTSGLSVGVEVARRLGKSLAIAMLKPGRCWNHRMQLWADGGATGHKYIFVDDQISSGRTLQESRELLQVHDKIAEVIATYQYQWDELEWNTKIDRFTILRSQTKSA